MELKVKLLKWSAGLPVAMLHKKTAEKLSVHPEDRISIKTTGKKRREVSTLIDTIEEFIKEDEIAVSFELKKYSDFHNGQKVEVNPSNTPDSLNFIKKKLSNKVLTEKEIKLIIKDVINNSLSEAEIALFISAVYKYGMNIKEIIYLVKSIKESGSQLNFDHGRIVADKHSVGGIPGNRTTPIVVSICASAGLLMPKNSSRAITSAAGTADVIETVAEVDFSIKELKKVIKKTNACMVWGGALEIVPADSILIRIEKSLKIDPEPMLLASIMSKKLAAGSNHVIIDIPYGKGAKHSRKKAIALKKKFEVLGKYFKIKIKCVLTDGSQPIGNGIGPALEMRDILKVLNVKERNIINAKDNGNGMYPADLEKKSLFIAGELLELTGKAGKGKGIQLATRILYSGKAFEKFREIIEAQRGSLKKLKEQRFHHIILSKKPGKVTEIKNSEISSLARIAGCPLDKYSGIYLHCHKGHKLKKNQKILTIYAESKSKLASAIRYYKETNPLRIN